MLTNAMLLDVVRGKAENGLRAILLGMFKDEIISGITQPWHISTEEFVGAQIDYEGEKFLIVLDKFSKRLSLLSFNELPTMPFGLGEETKNLCETKKKRTFLYRFNQFIHVRFPAGVIRWFEQIDSATIIDVCNATLSEKKFCITTLGSNSPLD
jgi:hypothetical protein